MTIEEAIRHCEEVAEDNEAKALRIGQQYEGTLLDRDAKECRRCAAEHRQLAEWLQELRARRHYMDKICEVLAEQFGYPCNYSPVDEYMLENGGCDDCCGNIPDAECWSRYLQTKIVGGSENG